MARATLTMVTHRQRMCACVCVCPRCSQCLVQTLGCSSRPHQPRLPLSVVARTIKVLHYLSDTISKWCLDARVEGRVCLCIQHVASTCGEIAWRLLAHAGHRRQNGRLLPSGLVWDASFFLFFFLYFFNLFFFFLIEKQTTLIIFPASTNMAAIGEGSCYRESSYVLGDNKKSATDRLNNRSFFDRYYVRMDAGCYT